ncbi:MAG: hypothetical protein R3F60_30505 [bacterium]
MRRIAAALALALAACSSDPAPAPKEAKSMNPIQNFRSSKIDAARLQVLVADPAFASAIALDVTGSPVGEVIGEALAQSPHAGRLKSLWLDQTGLTDAQATALGGSKAPLVELYAGYNPLGPAGLKALLATPAARLVVLRLTFTRIGDEGAALLARHPRLDTLERLELTATGLTDAGIRALLGSTTLAHLAALELGHNTAGPRALEPLLDPAHLPRLQTLDVSGLAPDPALVEQVRAARPGLEVVTGG